MTATASSTNGSEDGPGPLGLFKNPEFVALASVRFVSGMAFATIIIALALYADIFEASGIVAGLFGTAYAVVRLFLVLPLGRMIDVGNSKRWLLAGLGFNVVLLVGYMLVGAVEHVILLRAFQAIGSMMLWVTGLAVVGEISPDNERGMWVGTYNQTSSIASLFGDVVGGAMLFVFGFGTTYAVLVAFMLVSAILVFVFLRDDPGSRADPNDATGIETYVNLLRRRVIRSLVVFRFSFSFGKMAVIIFLPIFARTEFGMNAFLIGAILAGGKLVKGLSQGYVGQYADRVGRYDWFIVAGTVGYAVGTALIPLAMFVPDLFEPLTFEVIGDELVIGPAFLTLFVAYSILGFADSLRLPTSMALFVQEGEHYDAAAASLSLRSVSWQVGAVFGPLTVGATLDYTTFLEAFWLAAVFMIGAGIVFYWLYETEPDPDTKAVPADDD